MTLPPMMRIFNLRGCLGFVVVYGILESLLIVVFVVVVVLLESVEVMN